MRAPGTVRTQQRAASSSCLTSPLWIWDASAPGLPAQMPSPFWGFDCEGPVGGGFNYYKLWQRPGEGRREWLGVYFTLSRGDWRQIFRWP